jgi:hypothetical protein
MYSIFSRIQLYEGISLLCTLVLGSILVLKNYGADSSLHGPNIVDCHAQ